MVVVVAVFMGYNNYFKNSVDEHYRPRSHLSVFYSPLPHTSSLVRCPFVTNTPVSYFIKNACLREHFIFTCVVGIITPNKIPLTTIVTYLQKRYRSRISNHWATIPACSVVPPIYKQLKKNILSHIMLATYRKFR